MIYGTTVTAKQWCSNISTYESLQSCDIGIWKKVKELNAAVNIEVTTRQDTGIICSQIGHLYSIQFK